MQAAAVAATRATDGRFAPGVSGNPAGRPKGARNRASLAAEALLEESGGALVEKLLGHAQGGDGAALRFLVARLLPVAKGERITLEVEAGRADDLVHVHEVALRALLAGEITVEAALKLARFLAIGAKLRAQVAKRVARAAQAHSSPPRPAGEGREGAVRATAAQPRSAEAPPPQPSPAGGGGGTGRPVSDVYFPSASRAAASMRRPAPVSDLYFSTALARVEAARAATSAAGLFPPVFSRAA